MLEVVVDVMYCTPFVPQYKGFWMDVTHHSTVNIERQFLLCYGTERVYIISYFTWIKLDMAATPSIRFALTLWLS